MLEKMLRETDAFLEGHFLLSSGKHSDGYVQCAKLLMHPEKAEKAVELIVEKLGDLEVDLVVGPAMGGIVVSYELARQLGKPAIFTERENGVMTLRRGFTIEEGQKVLIAEDVVTTGKSAYEAIEAVEKVGGEVVGIGSIVDRSDGDIRYPLYSGVKLDIKTYEADECPMCKDEVPIVQLGSRKIAGS